MQVSEAVLEEVLLLHGYPEGRVGQSESRIAPGVCGGSCEAGSSSRESCVSGS